MTKVIVTSALELSAAQLENIKTAAAKKYGKNVSIEASVDETLIGGVQITIGSRQLDGSIKGKLEQIRQKFVQRN